MWLWLSRHRNWLVPAVKLLLVVLVSAGIGSFIWNAREDFRQQGLSLAELDAGWLCLAGLFYLLGMLPSGLFWHRALLAMRQQPRLGETLRAYYIGHLGKYVPGKALVVVLRTGLIRGFRVDTTVAAVSVFFETLTMMTVGAFVAALLLATRFAHHWGLLLLALSLMFAAGVPTLPPVLPRLVSVLRVAREGSQAHENLRQISFRFVFLGWCGVTFGWSLIGLSMWATVRAMPAARGQLTHLLNDLPLLTAAVSLAMVAGFLSLLPGGIGVREFVMMPLMATQFDAVTSVIAPLLLRVVWLVSELAVSGILYGSYRWFGRNRNLASAGDRVNLPGKERID